MAVNSWAQDIEGPIYQPQYNFEDTGSRLRFADGVPEEYASERERSIQENRRFREEPLRMVIQDLPSFCIVTPIPIDDRYVGCLIHFEPETARVDVWD